MKCPKCHLENVQGAKFCSECGAKLEMMCPACGKTNTPGGKFCIECGQPLTAAKETSPDYSKPGR